MISVAAVLGLNNILTRAARLSTSYSMTSSLLDKNHSPINILALEASGDHASVALCQDGVILDERILRARHGHAASFVDMAAEMVDASPLTFSDITHIAAGVGPGSFTGLRVCLAAAKGFTLAGGLIGWGVNGLRARALATLRQHPGHMVLSCADTRRGPYFTQGFDAKGAPLTAITEIMPDALAAHCQELGMVEAIIAAPPSEAPLPATVMAIDMTAADIALSCWQDYQRGERPQPLDPLYVAAPKLGPSKASQAGVT